MNLTKEKWTKNDITEFQTYLKSLSKGEEKSIWEQRIVNTKLPCLAVPSTTIDKIVKEIGKGNFLSFIDLWIWEYHSNTLINGKLICKIKDFQTQKKYLLKYSQQADNWSTTDCLKLKFTQQNKKDFIEFSKELANSPYTFSRRLSLIILLKLSNENELINDIFEISSKFKDEIEYYVNMANAWLIAEMFTKHRLETLEFLKEQKLNSFTTNKAISKCRDSYRISKEDKKLLLKYRA